MARQLVKVTYHDGKEFKREIVTSELIRQPVVEMIAQGTITSVSRGGLRLDLHRALVAMSTAYTFTGRNTATGRHPTVGLVAVDPTIIPMGSRLYVEGYGFATAADRGSSIKGKKIDVFMESEAQCRKWGMRSVKVYVLK
jgi:3D (Asp-Asp-Asp) domain-containing protein